MNKVFKLRLLPIALLVGTGFVNAASPGGYIGAGAGLSSLESLPGLIKDKESAFGGRLFLGYNFNPYFGIETNYSSLDKTRYLNNAYPLASGDFGINALSLVGKLYLPFPDDGPFSLYGILGVAKVYGKFDVLYKSVTYLSASDEGFVPTGGIGVMYDINQRVAAGLELSGFGEKEPSNSIGVPSSLLATFSLAYKF